MKKRLEKWQNERDRTSLNLPSVLVMLVSLHSAPSALFILSAPSQPCTCVRYYAATALQSDRITTSGGAAQLCDW
jgi:hypothetical protein